MTIVKGEKVDYKLGISVSDNRDPNPTLNIDDSKVNVDKLGRYKVIYTAKDRSGNKVVKERIIKVVERWDFAVLR